MGKMKKTVTVLGLAVLLLCLFSLTALAEDANVSYSGNSGDWIFEPGSEHSPTDLFTEFKNVMPGASLTQKITVTNKADSQVKVKIYLRSLGSADEKYNDFLNQLTLTVTKGTDTPLFDAAADQTGGLTEWVCLGTLYAGGSLDLNLTLQVPESLENSYQDQIGMIRWQFVTEEFPMEEPSWTCPVNEKHQYHIEDIDGVTNYVCDDCGTQETMKCEICGGEMHEVMVVSRGEESYVVYPEGGGLYTSEDSKVHFHLNEHKIIDYYIVDGQRTDIKDVNKYVLYTYYECLDDSRHHTDPLPVTGDDFSAGLWITLLAISVVMLILVPVIRRKNRKKEDGGTKC